MNTDLKNIWSEEQIRREVSAMVSARIDLQFSVGVIMQNSVATALNVKPITIEEIIEATKEFRAIKDKVTDLALWCYAWQRAANAEACLWDKINEPFSLPLTIISP